MAGNSFIVLIILLFANKLLYTQSDRRAGDLYSSVPLQKNMEDNIRGIIDTVYYPVFGDECALEAVTIGIENGWGRISGMNFFGDREKAQRLEFTGSETFLVTGALVFFEKAAIVGDGTINCKIYTVDPGSGGPLAIRGFSNSLKVSDVVAPDSVARATSFSFESGVEIQLDSPFFFVSVDLTNLYGSRDTLVILQTILDCGDGNNTWELFGDGITWTPISGADSWQINADFLMAAIVDFNDPTSLESYIAHQGIKIHPVFPNPASESVHLDYTLENTSIVNLEIYDNTGKLLQVFNQGTQLPGRYLFHFNIGSLPAGEYFYRIKAGDGSLTSRFIIGVR